MLTSVGCKDTTLVSEICKGFDRLGDAYICIYNPDTAPFWGTSCSRRSAERLLRCGIWASQSCGCRGPSTLTITCYLAKKRNVVTLTSFKPGLPAHGLGNLVRIRGGVEICVGEAHLGLLTVQNTKSRKRKLAAAITHVLNTRGAPSKDFECLRGSMLFAEGQIFGRRANQSMKILSAALPECRVC